MHLVGFIIRIYHDARSRERQKSVLLLTSKICDFDVLLTVHLSIILVINQLNAHILVF
jgi:hypothetical protein